jgi:hypothetical protein
LISVVYWKRKTKTNMQIEFSPITGVMVGVNYAYYEETEDLNGLHLVQFALGLFMIQVSWTT